MKRSSNCTSQISQVGYEWPPGLMQAGTTHIKHRHTDNVLDTSEYWIVIQEREAVEARGREGLKQKLMSIRRTFGTHRYSATFERNGVRAIKGRVLNTVLLSHINLKVGPNHEEFEVADHMWFPNPGSFQSLNLKKGDRVAFTATLTTYRRKDGTKAYKLVIVRKVRKESIDKSSGS